MKQLTINLTENSHQYAEMIAAKAADMSLVVLQNAVSPDYWCENVEDSIPAFRKDWEYFLCLPKHKKECLHWLNGGDCLVAYDSIKDVKGLLHGSGDKTWSAERAFMNPAAKITIKPKKEKRWIGVSANGITINAFDSQQEAYDALPDCKMDWGIYEIEVEVTQ